MPDDERHEDPVLARGLTRPRRRDVLGLGGLAAAGLALAACSGGGSGAAPPEPPGDLLNTGQRVWAAHKRHGHVNVANWPLYIDTGHKTLQEYTATTGITVSYAEVIQSAPSWVSKVSPIIQAGESIGYDLMVVTNGFWFSQLLTGSELIPLDQS